MNPLNYIYSKKPNLKGTPISNITDFLTGEEVVELMEGYRNCKESSKKKGKRFMYTDGACKGNSKDRDGNGGWAYSVLNENMEEIGYDSGFEPETTNQRMEMTAVIEGLRKFNPNSEIEIFSDSAYVVNCFKDNWIEGWKKNGWKNAKGKPVANQDLWESLDLLVKKHNIVFTKVKGHSGDEWNERVDVLASNAAKSA